MNQSGNRNSIFGWVKNLKRNTLSNDSINEISDELSVSESRSPSRTSFQNMPFPSSPVKEKQFPQISGSSGGASEFLRPLLSHKSRSTNNVNQSRSESISTSLSHQDSSSGLRQRRDSFLQVKPLIDENSKYFGVSLADAIDQASAKISILGSETSSTADDDVLHYGRIPIVVAKCGVYLKKNGLGVEGIFRVAGSSKRIKELQIAFNSSPEFGKRLNWDGFTVHDAASVLRRYLNALPEPLIPLDLYEEFRDPLRSRPRIIKYLKYKADNSSNTTPNSRSASNTTPVHLLEKAEEAAGSEPPLAPDSQAPAVIAEEANPEDSAEAVHNTQEISAPSDAKSKPKKYRNLTRDVYDAVDDYKQLLDELPSLSKQLLFYILDLLAMVQSYSADNLMPSRNLAAIFQPSILSHPSHDMDPEEYALSQSVVEFLIQYSYKLLPNSEARPESSGASAGSAPTPDNADHTTPLRAPSKRQHSKSLSTPNHDLEFIGYRPTAKPKQSFALSDTEHDFVSASSDDGELFDDRLRENWNVINGQFSGRDDDGEDMAATFTQPTSPADIPSVRLENVN